MKKIIATLIIAILSLTNIAQAEIVNFTNTCNYKIGLQSVDFRVKPVEDESGDWKGYGIISFTLPNMPTSNVSGITYKPFDIIFNSHFPVYISNSVIQGKSGTNDIIKLNKVLKDIGRAVGSDFKSQFTQ